MDYNEHAYRGLILGLASPTWPVVNIVETLIGSNNNKTKSKQCGLEEQSRLGQAFDKEWVLLVWYLSKHG